MKINKMSSFYKRLFVLILLFYFTDSKGQRFNSYQFIEPNISISYDNNYYKITNYYSNSFYETEEYDFEYLSASFDSHTTFNIKAAQPPKLLLSLRKQDSIMLSRFVNARKQINDSIQTIVYDTVVRHINGFSCLGFVLKDKYTKSTSLCIVCDHVSENDFTEIQAYSLHEIDLEKKCHELADFLEGFRSYSLVQIKEEEDRIKQSYSVTVYPSTELFENFKFKKKTFVGIVKINEKLQHTIKEVRIHGNGTSKFIPLPNGNIPIICDDIINGNIIKNGEVILLNSFGKCVKIPFTFSYLNKSKI